MMIYRIEDDKGIGVYRSEISPNFVLTYEIGKPTPWEDTELLKSANIRVDDRYDTISDYSFGFSSKEQMKSWFGVLCIKKLIDCGFNVNLYMVDDKKSHSSKHQAMFNKNNAQLVRTLKFEELL